MEPPPPPLGPAPPLGPSPPPNDRSVSRNSLFLSASPWTAVRVIGLLAAWLGGGIVGALVAYVAGFDPVENAVGLAMTIVAQTLAALWVVMSVTRRSGSGVARREIGLELNPKDWVGLFYGIGLQIAVSALTYPLRLILDDFDTQQQVAELAEATNDAGGRLVLVAVFVLFAPFIEEIIFRGVMLSWLARHMSSLRAVIVSAAAFAAVHLADPQAAIAVPGLFLLGVVLGLVARRRRSISLPIFMHAGVNLLGAIALIWGDDLADFAERTENQLESLAAVFGLG